MFLAQLLSKFKNQHKLSQQASMSTIGYQKYNPSDQNDFNLNSTIQKQ